MGDYRDLLEQERRKHVMRDGTLEGLRRRQDRKRRNSQIAAGVLALLIAGAGIGGGLYALRSTTGPKPIVGNNPSPTPTTCPSNAPCPTKPPVESAGPSAVSGPIQFIDEQHGWMVDADGQILATADGGQTWNIQFSGPSDIKAIDILDGQQGWGVGDGGLIHTADGGAHWETWSNQVLSSIQFTTSKTGWGVEAAQGHPDGLGSVMKTDDGGRTWTSQGAEVNSVCISGESLGWAAGPHEAGAALFRTEDAGLNWTEIPIPMPGGDQTGWTATVRCGGDTAWVLVTDGGAAGHIAYAVLRMAGEGSQVEPVLQDAYTHPLGQGKDIPEAVNPYPGPLTAPDALSARFITWCPPCGGDQPFVSLERTQDGGATWTDPTVVDANKPAEPLGISFLDPEHGWVLLRELESKSLFVVRTSDGGQTWKRP
jgi:photosystem II stability/assembly factor-like uncharacterized protein